MNTTDDLAAAQFARIVTKTKDGHAHTVLVPGHKCRQYLVILRRDKVLSAECLLQAGKLGNIPCQGNSKTLCYHSRAALRVAAGERRIHFCELWQDAVLLARTGGKVAKAVSHQSGVVRWLVIK